MMTIDALSDRIDRKSLFSGPKHRWWEPSHLIECPVSSVRLSSVWPSLAPDHLSAVTALSPSAISQTLVITQAAAGEHSEPGPCFPHCLAIDGNALKHLSGSRMWTMGVIDPVSALHRSRSGQLRFTPECGSRDLDPLATVTKLWLLKSCRGQCRPIRAEYGRGLTNERRGSVAECFWPYRVGDFVLCTNWSPRRKGKFYMRRHVRLSRGSLSWSDARVVRLLPCPVLHCCIFRKKSGKFWPVINIKTLAIHGNFIPRVQIKCQTRKSAKCQLLSCSKKFH